MAANMSFKDHVSILIAEHERLECMLKSVLRENGALRERLKSLGGGPQRPAPLTIPMPAAEAAEEPPSPGKLHGSRGTEEQPPPGKLSGGELEQQELSSADKLTNSSSIKLTGNWDISAVGHTLPEQTVEGGSNRATLSDPLPRLVPGSPRRSPDLRTTSGGLFGDVAEDAQVRKRGSMLSTRENSFKTIDFNDVPPEVSVEWQNDWPVGVPEQASPTEILRFPVLPRAPSMICGEAMKDEGSCLQRVVMRPNSHERAAWDALSMLVLGFDIVTIPLEVFNYEDNEEFTMGGVEWATTTFWTVDILASFLTGFHSEGLVEMRPSRIAKRYLRGGFTLDLFVVLMDWMLAIFTFQVKAIIRVGKTARVFRLLRMIRAMRLIRSLKLARLLTSLFAYIKSDFVRTICSIFLMLLVLVVFNHYIACGWYLIGIIHDDGWLQAHILETKSNEYLYTTALHWSLTQFTPASMEVYPHNLTERIYTVCVLLFALVTFSSFVSGITSGMMYVRKLKTEPARQEAILRQYFQESRISAELGQRIWKFLQNNHFQHRKRVHRSEIPILKLVPETLVNKLSEELYLPVVTWNPFMRHFGNAHMYALTEVCHHAITEKCLTTREELFIENKVAERMYFISMGTMEYRHRQSQLCRSVTNGLWACEPALWMNWTHCGRLSARTSCEIVQLHTGTFRRLVVAERFAHEYASSYANLFREYLLQHESVWYTDIWCNTSELEELVATWEDENPKMMEVAAAARPTWTSDQAAPVMVTTLTNKGMLHRLVSCLFFPTRRGSFQEATGIARI